MNEDDDGKCASCALSALQFGTLKTEACCISPLMVKRVFKE